MTTISNIGSDDPNQEVILGPIKIFDGLFMGDQLAAKDIQFIISNKVTHIINTVVHRIPNLWENFCVHYLSVGWTQKQTNIFDKKDKALNAIYDFIQQAHQRGESCLVHSVNGKSRACAIIVSYLMKKFKWSLSKCLKFVDNRKENLHIRINYLSQLENLQQKLKKQHSMNEKWQQSNSLEETVINNTYKNSLSSNGSFPFSEVRVKGSKRICWKEENNQFYEKGQTVQYQPITEYTVKPILKQTNFKEDYGFYKNITPEKEKEDDSLDKLLFESGKNQKVNDKKCQRSTRNTTLKMGSLEKLQSKNQCRTMKKLEHYTQVLASYHGIPDEQVQTSYQISTIRSISIKQSKDKKRKKQTSRDSDCSQQTKKKKLFVSPKKAKKPRHTLKPKIKHDFN